MTTLNKFVKTIDMRFFCALAVLIVTLCSNSIWASSDCSKRNVKLKDCLFTLDNSKVHVWNDKILLNSLVARDKQELPTQAYIDKGVTEWSFVKAQKLNSRWFLELGIWLPPIGEGEVETLKWYVYEVRMGAINKLLEKPLQKRKKVEGGKNKDAKFKFDQISKYGLSATNSEINWHVGREKGVIK